MLMRTDNHGINHHVVVIGVSRQMPENPLPHTNFAVSVVRTDGMGTLRNGPQALGRSRRGPTTKIHLVAADARTA